MTDFRALCEELVNDLEEWVDGYLISDPADEHTAASFGRINRARAALAQPEPVAPTDEEIMELMPQQMRDDLANAARALAWVNEHDSTCAAGAIRIIFNRHAVDHARAVLAKGGHQ
jgi:hypothetical protein